MFITGKVYIQSSSEDSGLDLRNIDLNQFYNVFPVELRAYSEAESSTIIRLRWWRESASTQKGATIYLYYHICCLISLVDPLSKKVINEGLSQQVYGERRPGNIEKIERAPAWPVKEVSDFLRKILATKICANCKKEIILESWTCPHCGHAFSDEEMLVAENEIRIKKILEQKKYEKGLFVTDKKIQEWQKTLQEGEVLPLEDGPLSRKNSFETYARLYPVLKEDHVIQFYKNTQAAWAGGKLAGLGALFWAESKLSFGDFVAKYRPREGNIISIFLEQFHPLKEEFLIQFDSGLSWFILTNLRLIQKDGASKTFHEVALSDIGTYEISGGFFSWGITLKMKSGKKISFKKVTGYPSKQAMSWLLKNFPL